MHKDISKRKAQGSKWHEVPCLKAWGCLFLALPRQPLLSLFPLSPLSVAGTALQSTSCS